MPNITHKCPTLLTNAQHCSTNAQQYSSTPSLLTNAQHYSPTPNITHQRQTLLTNAQRYSPMLNAIHQCPTRRPTQLTNAQRNSLAPDVSQQCQSKLTNAQHADVGVQHGAVAQHDLPELPVLPKQLLDASLHVELHPLVLVQLNTDNSTTRNAFLSALCKPDSLNECVHMQRQEG